jgi:hypothetical protein
MLIKNFFQFEQYISDIDFYIDVRNCNTKRKEELYSFLISKINKIYFDLYDFDYFLKSKDADNNEAWAWHLTLSNSYLKITGVHSIGWGMPELKRSMFTCDEAFLLDLNKNFILDELNKKQREYNKKQKQKKFNI